MKKMWENFKQKHPKAAKWLLTGGLFLIFSYVVTFIKLLLLIFLPDLFKVLVGQVEWLWPNIPVTILGVELNLSILGNALETDANGLVTGGLAFTLANLTTIVIGECINFPCSATSPSRAMVQWYPRRSCTALPPSRCSW